MENMIEEKKAKRIHNLETEIERIENRLIVTYGSNAILGFRREQLRERLKATKRNLSSLLLSKPKQT